MNVLPFFICIFFSAISLTASAQSASKPNIIFILSDDIGYEIPTINGGQSYSTPNIDSMARHGMNFTHCEASPLCSPSRFMLLTGKYNFKNYSIWALMNNGEKTIGNVMHDAGYKTGFFGKLQLTGVDSDMINRGFDDYLIFEAASLPDNGQRYKSPQLYTNGSAPVPDNFTAGKYADDLVTDRLLGFIDSNKNSPFFAYYPMSLAHVPFCPTPDDPAFATWDARPDSSNAIFFPSMIRYMDKIVGRIIQHLKATGLDQNTIVIFAGDNGTTPGIITQFNGVEFAGGKASTTEAGTHVPLIVYWAGHIAEGSINDDLVDFTDFFPTLANAAGATNLSRYGILDGRSFFPRLSGLAGNPRDWIFDHYDSSPDFDGRFFRWVQNKTYKLYDNTGQANSGKFYNIEKDPKEHIPLADAFLRPDQLAIKQSLQHILDSIPKAPDFPVLTNIFATNITANSAILGATIISNGGAPIKQRGSLYEYAPQAAYYYGNNLADAVSGLGTFQQLRTHLAPQKLYNYSLYAMNTNTSNSTGFIKGTFITCSAPPFTQPNSFTAKTDGCFVILNWDAVTFPPVGATKGGYLLVYSTGRPALAANPNRNAPVNIIANGKIFPVSETVLPVVPKSTAKVTALSPDSVYNFLLVPYTWDGSSDSTFNYLTAGALTIRISLAANKLTTTAIVTNPSCYGLGNGTITLTAANGFLPNYFNINAGSFQTSTVLKNIVPGKYSIVTKDALGCTDSISVTVTQPGALGLSITNTNDTCKGANNASIQLTGTLGIPPYQYSVNSGIYDTASIFNGLIAGTYSASVMDKNGCAFSSLVTITQSDSACPVIYPGEMKINVFPNPSQSQFKLVISYSVPGHPISIKVVDIYGKTVFRADNATGNTYSFGKNFASGIYFLKVQQDGDIKTIRILKVN